MLKAEVALKRERLYMYRVTASSIFYEEISSIFCVCPQEFSIQHQRSSNRSVTIVVSCSDMRTYLKSKKNELKDKKFDYLCIFISNPELALLTWILI